MTRGPDRRRCLQLAGAAATALLAGRLYASENEVQGSVVFAEGAKIPEGLLRIIVEAPGRNGSAVPEQKIETDGNDAELPFSVPSPADIPTSAQIVAVLERADGWLLARGSASFASETPVIVTLYKVMY